MEIPILFLIFKRLDVSVEAFKSIKSIKPKRLYIAADGPRDFKVGEREECINTRNAILDMIDWECEVKTLFRDNNLGCAKAVSEAIDWFFENEEFGIIIEDDIVLSSDFCHFAKLMNEKYKDENRIMSINAQYIGKNQICNSYNFSKWPSPWGWATWRRAWKHMDMKMRKFPMIPFTKYIKDFGFVKGTIMYYYYWRHDYKIIAANGDISSWATRWAFNVFANDGLVIVPSHNLALNIGCSVNGSTHYNQDDVNPYSYLKLEEFNDPIIHPLHIEQDKLLREIEIQDFIRIRWMGIMKKIRNRIKSCI